MMYDATGVRLHAGRQAEVSFHTIWKFDSLIMIGFFDNSAWFEFLRVAIDK